MEDRVEALRRRIALYRGYLEEGVSSELASHYLREIRVCKLQLEQIASKEKRR